MFSTGDYIDSLSISGIVTEAFTKEPVENVAVMLYSNLEDSIPLTSPPYYFDRTDENGEYIISNLKQGTYRLFALEDQNQNYYYDQPSERIGFVYPFINLNPDTNYRVNVPIFLEDNKTQFISKTIAAPYGFLTIVMNKPFENLSFRIYGRDPEHGKYIYKLWPGKDTLQFWFPDYEEEFILEINDVNNFSDSVDVKIVPVYSIEDEMPAFSIKSNVKNKMDLNTGLVLEVLHPITQWDPTLIKLLEDSVEAEINPYFTDSTKTTIRIDYPWHETRKYNLMIGLGAMIDMYGLKNDLYELKFGAQDENYYGAVNFEINLPEKEWPYIIEMFDPSGKTLSKRQFYKSGTIRYPQLPPGKYGFRIIEDINENGRWDPGNYQRGTPPEQIYYLKELVEVRSNWELEQTWNISEY